MNAAALLQDPRIAKAKQMLLDAVLEQRNKIQHVSPPIAEQQQSYEQTLAQFAEIRGGKTWFPYIGSGLGNGALVELADGSVKYDLISGIGVHFFGHSNPAIISASLDAAISDTVTQGHLQQNQDSVELSQLLINASKLAHCFLTTSGAMATENGLKIALQKKFPATRILAFNRCFMGRTLTLSQITDKPAYRENLPINLDIDYIPFYDPLHPEESTKQAKEALKKHIARYPKSHAVMIFELVQGEAGFYPGTKEFFTTLMDILKENKIAIFVDEVQTFGRTPELFAFQYFGLEHYIDICTIGKLSLACATLFTKEFNPKPGLLSQTFSSTTASIRCSKVIIKTLLEGGYYGPNGKIVKIHEAFLKGFEAIHDRHPHLISGPYGIGAMIAFTPFDGNYDRVIKFSQDLFKAGVIGFIAGSNPTRIRFLPPAGIITIEEINQALKIVEETLCLSSGQ